MKNRTLTINNFKYFFLPHSVDIRENNVEYNLQELMVDNWNNPFFLR